MKIMLVREQVLVKRVDLLGKKCDLRRTGVSFFMPYSATISLIRP